MTIEDDNLQSAIIDEIHAELGRQGMSMKQLAKKMNRPYDSSRDYLKKERMMPLGFFLEACGALGVDPDQVITDARTRL